MGTQVWCPGGAGSTLPNLSWRGTYHVAYAIMHLVLPTQALCGQVDNICENITFPQKSST